MISSKSVKINKPHRCWGCGRVAYPGGIYMTRHTQILKETIVSSYWCHVCMKVLHNNKDDFYENEISEGDIRSKYSEEWEDIKYILEVEGGIVA